VTEAVIDKIFCQGSRTFWIEIQKSMKIDSKKRKQTEVRMLIWLTKKDLWKILTENQKGSN